MAPAICTRPNIIQACWVISPSFHNFESCTKKNGNNRESFMTHHFFALGRWKFWWHPLWILSQIRRLRWWLVLLLIFLDFVHVRCGKEFKFTGAARYFYRTFSNTTLLFWLGPALGLEILQRSGISKKFPAEPIFPDLFIHIPEWAVYQICSSKCNFWLTLPDLLGCAAFSDMQVHFTTSTRVMTLSLPLFQAIVPSTAGWLAGIWVSASIRKMYIQENK